MGVIRKARDGVSDHTRRQSQAKAARAQGKAAQTRAELAGAEARIVQEQDAAIARALRGDEAHRQADIEEVAVEEAEAVPWDRPAGS